MTDTDITAIVARNSRVEADKAWETSMTRKAVIAVITYAVAVAVMLAIGVAKPFLSALIPVIGFMLSTLTLRGFKAMWLQYVYNKGQGAS